MEEDTVIVTGLLKAPPGTDSVTLLLGVVSTPPVDPMVTDTLSELLAGGAVLPLPPQLANRNVRRGRATNTIALNGTDDCLKVIADPTAVKYTDCSEPMFHP